MEYRENDFPQKQQVPVEFRRRVGDDAQARSFCPINGTTFDGQRRPITEKGRQVYAKRKARERQRQTDASRRGMGNGARATQVGRTRPQGDKRPSSGSTPEASVPALPVQSPGTCHMWTMEDPSATSIPVNYRGSTTRAHAGHNHPFSPPYPPSAPEQLAESVPDDGDDIRLHFPYLTHARTSRSAPEPSTAAVDMPATHYPQTTVDPKKHYEDSSMRSSPLPTAWTEDFGVSPALSPAYVPPSAPDSARSATQGSWWCNDRFIAVYQGFFIPRSTDNHHSSSPSLDQGEVHPPNTREAEHVNGGPVPQDQASTVPAPTSTSTGEAANPDTDDQSEVAPAPGLFYWTFTADGVFVDWSIPPAMVAPFAPVDRAQWVALEMAAMTGYVQSVHLQASLVSSAVPEEAYATMHSSPPTAPSSFSELAHAFAGSSQPFVSTSVAAPSKLATARRRRSSHPDVAWAHTSRQHRSTAPASRL